MSIPLVDLKAQFAAIEPQVTAAMRDVLDRCAFIRGRTAEAFEQAFADFCVAGNPPDAPQRAFCAGCGNGTDALYLALRALGVGSGDEVVTPAHTFIATAEAITLVGATPVFVDVQPDTLLVDPDKVEAAVTPRTKAVIAVHLYGQPCDMDRLSEIAQRHGLKVIEDAAQAHGARWRGRRVGTLGDAACFSFYPGKNLGAYGDAGAVVSHDEDLVRHVAKLSNHGRSEKYAHEIEGVNSRLDGLQAAVLSVKLAHLDDWNRSRQAHAEVYTHGLQGAPLVLPTVDPRAEHVWHLYVVRSKRRDEICARLNEAGISTGIHYPLPLHLQPAYASLGCARGSLPRTEQAADEILSLPMYPELTDQQIAAVCDAVCAAAV